MPLFFLCHGCQLVDILYRSGHLNFLYIGVPERPWQLLKIFDISQIFHLTYLAYTWFAGRRYIAFIAGYKGYLLDFGQMYQ